MLSQRKLRCCRCCIKIFRPHKECLRVCSSVYKRKQCTAGKRIKRPLQNVSACQRDARGKRWKPQTWPIKDLHGEYDTLSLRAAEEDIRGGSKARGGRVNNTGGISRRGQPREPLRVARAGRGFFFLLCICPSYPPSCSVLLCLSLLSPLP